MKQMTMNPSRISLGVDARAAVIELLQPTLADAIVLQLQAKQAHWNVKGGSFIAVHELFDKVAETLAGHVDAIAERIVMLGGVARGTLDAISEGSRLPAYPEAPQPWKKHVEEVADRLAAYGKALRADVDKTAELGDAATSDLLTGVLRDVDKLTWFVESHLQA
jgi:starvation-inducible DNA-binding protein